MGLYDRDYGREEETPWDRYQRSQQPKSMTVILIVVTVVIHFIDLLTANRDNPDQLVSYLANWFACRHDTLIEPWTWFQFLSYGFLHDQKSIFHVVFNMIGLFVFGRMLEQRLGRWELLRFYLVSIFVGGIVGSVTYWVMGIPGGTVIGASGGVVALLVLFACIDPHSELLIMGVWPVKAWILAVVCLALNLFGSLSMLSGTNQSSTAYTVHLAGAVFGYLYHRSQWNLAWLDFSDVSQRLKRSANRTRLKIHDPDAKLRREEDEVDRLLEKIHASGEESLTRPERRLLERHSRRKRQDRGRNETR
ncbi:MAG: rhomboid family intramembrane serine protease [Planctomycetota bacterium]